MRSAVGWPSGPPPAPGRRAPTPPGNAGAVLDDPFATLPGEVLQERLPALVAESCAWAVGLSDTPHLVLRHGRPTPTGVTLGVRAETGLPLGDESGARLDLADARPGSFRDALAARTEDGALLADRYDAEVLAPFVDATCTAVAARACAEQPAAWDELLDDLGEDGSDPGAVARAAEWDSALRTAAEELALAALGDVPLVEVEQEGLPLSVVRAAEAATRAGAPRPVVEPSSGDDLAGALFLAEHALADLPRPVPPEQAAAVRRALRQAGVEPDEAVRLLDRLPLTADAADEVARLLEQDLER